jgi:hypothetical protein
MGQELEILPRLVGLSFFAMWTGLVQKQNISPSDTTRHQTTGTSNLLCPLLSNVTSQCSKDEAESSKSIESRYPTLSIQWLVVYPAIKKRSDFNQE